MIDVAGLRARASAFWLAWKYVLLCLVLLALSVALNVHQWKRALTAPLRAQNRELTAALDRVATLAEQRPRDDARLNARLDAIAAKIPTETLRYVTVAAKAPLNPTCAPGPERQQAVNAILGGEGGTP